LTGGNSGCQQSLMLHCCGVPCHVKMTLLACLSLCCNQQGTAALADPVLQRMLQGTAVPQATVLCNFCCCATSYSIAHILMLCHKLPCCAEPAAVSQAIALHTSCCRAQATMLCQTFCWYSAPAIPHLW
jgi:hypothetical protein